MDAALLVFITGVFIVAGAVKGLAGLGLPTVAMALLSLTLPAAQAASLMLLPSFVTNLWQALAGGALRRLARRLATMWLGIVAGTFLGVLPEMGAAVGSARAALGIVLVAYAAWGLARPQLQLAARHERWLAPLAGYATGTISAATGVFVVPAVPYLQSLRLPKDEMVQALGLCFTVSTVALAVQLAHAGSLRAGDIGLSVAALAPALAGLWLGSRLRRRVSDAAFRRVFFALLAMLGTGMAVAGLR